jgi:hydroxyacylglutathione hydrolase
MLVKTLPVGQLQTNCYIVTDENTLDCAVIDPGDESNTILDYLEENHLHCQYILITHGHYDHTMAVTAVAEATGAVICMNEKDANATIDSAPFRFNPPKNTIYYKEGDKIQVGGLTFQVLETPGHTPGGVTLLCEDCLFTGDTLFKGSCGRTDFPGGDMEAELRSLRRLGELPGDYEVYPGHMEATTLDQERRFNFYMKRALG